MTSPLRLEHLAELSERCRESGGGFEQFVQDERVTDLGWPDDVAEQWLYWFAGWEPFLSDYGQLDLRGLAWTDETLPTSSFLRMPTGKSDGDLMRENAENFEQRLHVRRHLGIPAYWERHGTWRRRPVLLHRGALGCEGEDLQVIEGRTRVGILRGRAEAGGFVAPTHAAWVGRTKTP